MKDKLHMEQGIVITKCLKEDVAAAVAARPHDRTFIITDDTTRRLCLPLISGTRGLEGADVISIHPGDAHKDIESLTHVWTELGRLGATRHSCVINLGGGMVTDLGGFAASTFKRGVDFINIPTTLLSMVDASVGGKTGINFNGLKNEVGVFNNARRVIIDTSFLKTSDRENLLSGYAEMLKHGLLNGDPAWAVLLSYDIEQPNLVRLSALVADSIAVKERIVSLDPHEEGLRKALNLGHTIGHAFESHALSVGRPILHGYAVAYGLTCELYLSCVKTGFPEGKLRQTATFVREHYGTPAVSCKDYDALIELMRHDKKNTGTDINFTLLADTGDIRTDRTATPDEIKEALDFIREGL